MESELNKKDIQRVEFEMLSELDQVCRENNLIYSLAYGTVLGAIRHKGFIPWDDDIDIMIEIDNYQRFCDILQRKLPQKYFVYSYETNPNYEYLFARIGLRDFRHHQIHIDIFPMVGLPKSAYGRKVFSKLAYLTYRCYFIKMVNANTNYCKDPMKKRKVLLLKALLFLFPSRLFIYVYERLKNTFPISRSSYIYNFCGLYKYKEIISNLYMRDLVTMDFEGQKFPVPNDWDKYLTHMYGDYMTPKKTNYV